VLKQIILLARRPANERVQSGDQFLDVKRFHQIIVGTGVETIESFIESAAGGAKNDRDVGAPFPQIAEDAQAVASGQHDVEDHRIVAAGGGQRESLVAVVAEIHDKALRFESFAQKPAELFVVFDHEDFHGISLTPMAFAVERKFIKEF